MRHILLFAPALFCTIAGAQPVIDIGSAPVGGQDFVYVLSDYIAPVGTGAGQTWNFSSATSSGSDGFSYLDAAAASVPSAFPSADVVQQTTQLEDYLNVLPTGLYSLGQYLPSYPITITYTDPFRFLAFPCSLGVSWTDVYTGSYDYTGNTYDAGGTGDFNASGYGDLVLPWGTVSNVLRVDAVLFYSEEGNGNLFEYDATESIFYKPGVNAFVAKTRQASWTMNGSPAGASENLFYMEQASIGMSEFDAQALGLEVMPNPADQQATLVFTATGRIALDVIDANGRTVLQQDLGTRAPGLHREDLDVSALPAGVYTARLVSSTGERGTQRFVVQH